MNKSNLISQILSTLETELKSLKAAALETYKAATHEESKPENEYDTRGLEASYLAGAQAKRVLEIEERIFVFKNLKVHSFAPDEAVSATALVKVRLHGKTSFVFVVPKGGGLVIQFEGHAIQTVTPTSPLGEALLGLKVGDTAIAETNDTTREYEILGVE